MAVGAARRLPPEPSADVDVPYDGDGIDDLAVAAIRDSAIAREAGAVYVLSGVAGAR